MTTTLSNRSPIKLDKKSIIDAISKLEEMGIGNDNQGRISFEDREDLKIFCKIIGVEERTHIESTFISSFHGMPVIIDKTLKKKQFRITMPNGATKLFTL